MREGSIMSVVKGLMMGSVAGHGIY